MASMNPLEHIFQLLDQQKMLPFIRGADIDEIQKFNLPQLPLINNNNNANIPNGYCKAYSSGNSSTSSLRSSPTSSILSSEPTSPLQITPTQHSLATIKKKSTSSKQSRAAHNELEKNRRANLRSYLDQIKEILPPEYDSSRDTTLSLLTRARNYIRHRRQKREQLTQINNDLAAKSAQLKKRIEQAKALRNSKRCRQVEQQVQEKSITPVMEVTPVVSQTSVNVTPINSPIIMEYNSYLQTVNSPAIASTNNKMVTIDPYLEGLLPAVPLLYPYPYVQQTYNRSTVV